MTPAVSPQSGPRRHCLWAVTGGRQSAQSLNNQNISGPLTPDSINKDEKPFSKKPYVKPEGPFVCTHSTSINVIRPHPELKLLSTIAWKGNRFGRSGWELLCSGALIRGRPPSREAQHTTHALPRSSLRAILRIGKNSQPILHFFSPNAPSEILRGVRFPSATSA